ncbi:MAG TPA: metal-dependent transcriptional regulator [Longilinea sp.]|nr:metal-dependent transcriptional regulator [Longilinea sp.]
MSPSPKKRAVNRPTPTIEDYLAILYIMERDGEEVVAARLAESLAVAPPTVTMTLRRMERDGWIADDPGHGIHLTQSGCDAASSVIRRNMLTEWMLARMLKIPWSNIHAEADQIEHTISDEIEASLRTNLDDPQLCPHGNPLPGYEYIAADWIPLTDVAEGEQVIIRRIHEMAEDNHELLQFLEANGMVPGAQAEVIEILPFNRTMGLKIGKKKVTLGFPTTKYIYVEMIA